MPDIRMKLFRCEYCALQSDTANEIISFVRGYADREDWKFIRHIYLRTEKIAPVIKILCFVL